MLGMDSYNPYFYSVSSDIINELGQELNKLIGKDIIDIWVVYDKKNNEWFKDCPIVLNVEGIKAELCAFKMEEFAITFNTIDMSEKLNWYDIDNFDLEWRKEPINDLLFVKNKKICNIELIEYNLQTEITYSKDNPNQVGKKHSTWILNGIGFELTDGYFSVFNGLDVNDISIKPDLSNDIRTFKLLNDTQNI